MHTGKIKMIKDTGVGPSARRGAGRLILDD